MSRLLLVQFKHLGFVPLEGSVSLRQIPCLRNKCLFVVVPSKDHAEKTLWVLAFKQEILSATSVLV